MPTSVERQLASLRHRAEIAIAESRRESEIEALLCRILNVAEERSEPAIFAHRHLAEVRLTENPWQAALHLRKVLAELPHDHVSHALMGLSQALLGNYEAAVAAFKRATHAAPRVPWYLHNIGHLLDVALDVPEQAERYLRQACSLARDHDEVAASLAHCLARLGILDEAMMLAMEASVSAPDNQNHQALLNWISQGAPQKLSDAMTLNREFQSPLKQPSETTQPATDPRSHQSTATIDDLASVTTWLKAQGHPSLASVATQLWEAFRETSADAKSVELNPGALAYAVCRLNGKKVSQRTVAMDFGVPFGALGAQWRLIRDTLSLEPRDARFRL